MVPSSFDPIFPVVKNGRLWPTPRYSVSVGWGLSWPDKQRNTGRGARRRTRWDLVLIWKTTVIESMKFLVWWSILSTRAGRGGRWAWHWWFGWREYIRWYVKPVTATSSRLIMKISGNYTNKVWSLLTMCIVCVLWLWRVYVTGIRGRQFFFIRYHSYWPPNSRFLRLPPLGTHFVWGDRQGATVPLGWGVHLTVEILVT